MVSKIKPLIVPLLVFTLTYLLCLPHTLNYCQQIKQFDFDTQNLMFWDQLSASGYIPYRDTFYLYGLLFFYKSQSLLFFTLFTLISPLLFTLIYFTLIAPLFKTWYLRLVIYLSIVTIALGSLGIIAFSRYGLLTSFSLLSVFILFKCKKKDLKPYLLLGGITGLLLFVSNADALYIAAAQFILITYHHFAADKPIFTKSIIFAYLKKIFTFGLGLLIGSVPLQIFFFRHHLWSVIPRLLFDIASGAEYGKVPLLLNNNYEVFIIFSLFIGLVILCLRVINPRLRYTYLTYCILAAFISLFIMLQKHLVRGMANILFYFAFILIISLFGQVKIKRFIVLFILYVCFFVNLLVFLKLPFPWGVYLQSIASYSFQNLPKTFSYHQKLCRLELIDWTQFGLPNSFTDVVRFIESEPKSNQIFSFPFDPLFYTVLRQKPAPYPNLYNASPDSLQELNIDFIKNQEVKYVIYNLRAHMIDAVPDYLRGRTTLSYLINNFTPIKYFDPYLVLQKNHDHTKPNFFSKTNQTQYRDLYYHLSHLSWGAVPFVEAQNKDLKLLATATQKAYFNSNDELNQFLKSNPWDITNGYLLFHSPVNATPQLDFTLTNEASLSSQLVVNQFPDSNQLIHLSNVPMFMSGGQLTSLKFDQFPDYLWLITNPNIKNVW